ncbi:MAG: GlsB/YeaQ/YmgE family stress response membrane protein [Polyangiaceae bacterium]|nr:GlsB/YeaQ/YmgE family stress response membrane protein [Polyangiaceae bacterium]
MGLITFILFGFVVGLIARAIMPGRQSMGIVATALLGIAGSFVGGLLGSLIHRGRNIFDLHTSGIIGSIIGALIVMFLVGLTGRGRRAMT